MQEMKHVLFFRGAPGRLSEIWMAELCDKTRLFRVQEGEASEAIEGLDFRVYLHHNNYGDGRLAQRSGD